MAFLEEKEIKKDFNFKFKFKTPLLSFTPFTALSRVNPSIQSLLHQMQH